MTPPSSSRPTFYAGVERDNVLIHLQATSETKRRPGHGAVTVFVTDVDALDVLSFGMEASAP